MVHTYILLQLQRGRGHATPACISGRALLLLRWRGLRCSGKGGSGFGSVCLPTCISLLSHACVHCSTVCCWAVVVDQSARILTATDLRPCFSSLVSLASSLLFAHFVGRSVVGPGCRTCSTCFSADVDNTRPYENASQPGQPPFQQPQFQPQFQQGPPPQGRGPPRGSRDMPPPVDNITVSLRVCPSVVGSIISVFVRVFVLALPV